MTVYDRVVEMSEEELAEFLYGFAQDTINQFGNFVFPDKDAIRKFLEKETC